MHAGHAAKFHGRKNFEGQVSDTLSSTPLIEFHARHRNVPTWALLQEAHKNQPMPLALLGQRITVANATTDLSHAPPRSSPAANDACTSTDINAGPPFRLAPTGVAGTQQLQALTTATQLAPAHQ